MQRERKKIWIDITNAPHVMVFRPLIKILEADGHEVVVTAREFSQTLSLLSKLKIPFTEIGQHQGKSILKKILGLVWRSLRLVKFGAGQRFDVALSHGSNDLAIAAFLLRIPHVTMFDYEYAKVAHNINVRLSKKVLIPDIIPSDVLREYGGTDRKLDKYPGLKEEYYMHDLDPDRGVLNELGLDARKVLVVLRTPPELALYHRLENDIFGKVIDMLASRDDVQVVAIPRTPDQRLMLESLKAKNFIIPKTAVDAQSLIFYSDLVISAGGTMNREAVVLNTPVYTVFAGKMGAIDKDLIRTGRLKQLDDVNNIEIKKKDASVMPSVKDPRELVERILEAAR